MQRIEMNLMTGVSTIIELTPEEIAYAMDRTALESSRNTAVKSRTIEEKLAALGLTVMDIKTAASMA